MSNIKCSVFIAMSLDGFIATKDHGLDWLQAVEKDKPAEEDYGFNQFFASVDAVLLGRNTYDVVSKMPEWYYKDKKVYVLTHRPLQSKHGEKAVSGSLKEVLAQLEKDGIKKVYIDGGRTIQEGLREELIGDLTISVIPIILGSGIPLFAEVGRTIKLENTSALSFSTGLVQLKYETPAYRPG